MKYIRPSIVLSSDRNCFRVEKLSYREPLELWCKGDFLTNHRVGNGILWQNWLLWLARNFVRKGPDRKEVSRKTCWHFLCPDFRFSVSISRFRGYSAPSLENSEILNCTISTLFSCGGDTIGHNLRSMELTNFHVSPFTVPASGAFLEFLKSWYLSWWFLMFHLSI